MGLEAAIPTKSGFGLDIIVETFYFNEQLEISEKEWLLMKIVCGRTEVHCHTKSDIMNEPANRCQLNCTLIQTD